MRDCVFCKIINGIAPAKVVAKFRLALAFQPLNPVIEGHILVVPKRHVTDFAEDPKITARTMSYASRLAYWIGGDFNLITSKGAAATQTVNHLHVHLVPRTPGDGLTLPWTGQTPVDHKS
jgi:histidine triad (HIT) family protein